MDKKMNIENLLEMEDIENIELLTDEEMEKLNFHELCLYIGLLEKIENKMREGA
jgi:hypothetical protein